MALKDFLSLALASIAFFAVSSANAYITPGSGGDPQGQNQNDGWRGPDRGPHGPHGPGHPHPGPGPGPIMPYPPMPPPPIQPVPPAPPTPYPPNNGGYQQQVPAYIGRRVVNERISLQQIANLYQYNGYVLDSVIVGTRNYGGQLSLLINGQGQAFAASQVGQITLAPSYGLTLGREIGTLELAVNGVVDIDYVYINLHAGSNGGPNYGSISVPLSISQRVMSGGRLDLTPYIDMNRYRGLRLVQIDIAASSVYQTALLDVVINGFNAGQTINLSPYNQVYSLYPSNAILGQGADSIVLMARGDLNIMSVTLRLSR